MENDLSMEDKIESIIKGYNTSKLSNKKNDAEKIRKLTNESKIIKFYDSMMENLLQNFLQFLLGYDICSKMAKKKTDVQDINLNKAISLQEILNDIFTDFQILELEKLKKTNKEFKGIGLSKKETNPIQIQSIEPHLFIRFFDKNYEKIQNHLYHIDFSKKGMRECSDQEYQKAGGYIGCKIVGFFQLSEMKESFYASLSKFYCSDILNRKILVWDTKDFPVDKNIIEFRPINPYKQDGNTYVNKGEYVLRIIENDKIQNYYIPVKVYEHLNDFVWDILKEDISNSMEKWMQNKIKEKQEFIESLNRLYKKYSST